MSDDRQRKDSDEGRQPESSAAPHGRVLRLIAESLDSIRFGQIILTIHEGVVVQFDRLEKTRLR